REARQAVNRGLALNPVQLDLVLRKVWSHVQEGDLAAARAVLAAAPKEIERTALVAYLAAWGGGWILDAPRRDLLLRLTPREFGDDRAAWANALASEHWLRGELAEARRFAAEALPVYRERVDELPDDSGSRAGLGAMLAILGHGEEAAREAERAAALAPLEGNPWLAAEAHYSLAVVHTRLGNQEMAIDALERQLEAHTWLSPGSLRADANFAPLRGNPRFARLTAGEP
ncbi:MAG TPA: hypothetical protein VMT16_17065, partial [Thermoanaerobaculia bacterium]|nr:hypothetical protein [Thermoanaerobaculia bacterium]